MKRFVILMCLVMWAGPAWAAFPTVAATNNSKMDTNVTSHTVNLPTGIVSGNLLIVIFEADHSGSATITWPGTDWTAFPVDCATTNTKSVMAARYRVADGTEGASISITTSSAERSTHRSYRITGQHTSTVPECAVATSETGETAPDPPSLNPTGWDTEDTLWLTTATVGDGNGGAITGAPTNYSNLIAHTNGTADGGQASGSAERQLNAASDNPGTFGASGAGTDWGYLTTTIAIRPAAITRRPIAPMVME